MNATKDVALPDQFKDAMALVARVNALTVIKTKEEYAAAESDYRTLITNEKKLKIQFDDLDIVKAYNEVYEQYQNMKADFAKSKKYIKDVPMRKYDDEQERLRQAEQDRLAAIEQKKRDEETARLAAIEAEKQKEAEKERKRLEAIAAKTKDKEKKAQALKDAADAKARSEAAAREQEQIKRDAAAAPAATVIVEKTHQGVTRKKVYKYRVTTKDRRQFVKDSMKDSDRLTLEDLPTMPKHLFVLSKVLLNDYVDSQGEAAAIPGVLEVKFDLV